MYAVIETINGDPTLDMLKYVGAPCNSLSEAIELLTMHVYGKEYEFQNYAYKIDFIDNNKLARIVDPKSGCIYYKCFVMELN